MRIKCKWQQLTVKNTVALILVLVLCRAAHAADWTGACQSNPAIRGFTWLLKYLF